MKEHNDADFEFLRVCNPFSGGPKFSYEPERCQHSPITIEKLPDVSKLWVSSTNNLFRKLTIRVKI